MYGRLWNLVLIQNLFLLQAFAIGSRKPISDGDPIVPGSQPNSGRGAGGGAGAGGDVKLKAPLPRHWYTLELDVPCQFVKLIEDPQYSTPVVPIYDLAYLSPAPNSQVRRIPNIAEKLNEPNLMQQETRIVAEGISAPNDVGVIPHGTIDGMSPNVWWIAAGSTQTSTSTRTSPSPGQIYVLDMTKTTFNPVPLVSTPGFGYTHVEWEDMDMDGNSDVITIRAKPTGSELVWLQQPPTQSAWSAHVLDDKVGAQQFKTMWIDDEGNKRLLIICAGSREGELSVYWVDDPDNDWSRTSKIKKSIIGKEGYYINIEIVDVNGDGRLDILTSVSGMRGQPGKVICYEVPESSSFHKGVWKKHVLSNKFDPSENYRRISPGGVYPFYPGKSQKEKPSIIVSGADDGRVYLLRPQSWSEYIWHYETDIILLRKDSRIGIPAVADVDGDGNVEIFVPEKNFIHVLTYAGTENQHRDPGRVGKSGSLRAMLISTLLMLILLL